MSASVAFASQSSKATKRKWKYQEDVALVSLEFSTIQPQTSALRSEDTSTRKKRRLNEVCDPVTFESSITIATIMGENLKELGSILLNLLLPLGIENREEWRLWLLPFR
ncbi:Uncharacterized protein TCM_024394 [Theobroma cacao]|uniref:Uncharacterized protein n=1 Tax=Theobroma cacao TaxID=3641 RepID=A0A061F3F0_THECC|nr:Uncharacterized protein TCM_024394 [Theobroma cacao]